MLELLLALSMFQTPVVPGDKLAWDQPAASLAEAQGYTYVVTLNGQTPFVATGVTCVASVAPVVAPATCSIPFPAVPPGVDRTVSLQARTVVNATNVDSVPSVPLAFRLTVVPGTPQNLRKVNGE